MGVVFCFGVFKVSGCKQRGRVMPKIAEVAIDIPGLDYSRVFHYKIPDRFIDKIKTGQKVIVDFSGSRKEGFVVGFTEKTDISEIKNIEKIVEESPVVPPYLLDLSKWMSRKYFCSLAKAIQCIMPSGTNLKAKKIIYLKEGTEQSSESLDNAPLQREILEILKKNAPIEFSRLNKIMPSKNIYSAIQALEKKGFIEINYEYKKRVKTKKEKRVFLKKNPEKELLEGLSFNQSMILKELRDSDLTISNLSTKTGISYSSVYSSVLSLTKKGILDIKEVEVYRNPYEKLEYSSDKHLKPTQAQRNVLQLIMDCFEKKKNVLIRGVTGSGKTEIYIQSVEKLLKRGLGSIILVPEIVLTPQMVERFKSRFGDFTAVIHSGLSLGERFDEWRRIESGKARVVIGARSAVFAPVKNLGIIIIDEEHETSYKQLEDPKYNAIEIAEHRAKTEGAIVVMGSATPSIESYYRAQKGELVLAELRHRINNRPLPLVEVVDMKKELKQGNRSIFSRKLYNEIKSTLDKNQQVLLFLNRRGYSTFILCRECGLVLKCPHCEISLTYHFDTNTVKCHYCGFEQNSPDICPKCKGRSIRYFGIGTQKVEQEIKRAFQNYKVARMDSDTTTRKGSHKRILDDFKEKKIDILIGTQMISKGLDFPNIGLVGVVTADTLLNLPDFRAGERTFQLITQVAGRTGRGNIPGKVIVQTYHPEHYSIKAAKAHDYITFFNHEIVLREKFLYPPFTEMVYLVISGTDEKDVIRYSNILADLLNKYLDIKKFEIIGPSPAPISKIKDRFRWQILIKSIECLDIFIERMTKIINEFKTKKVSLHVDINPISLV
ncbi:MAG: hypothetical protein PWQ82_1825 [Thermosediminibacterales bacterium]|nr:hypothetical protein [Thermosediminibacterales bacterium]MDK2836064.1 hypothetical protein [Thermosediminibacterales bacterium]